MVRNMLFIIKKFFYARKSFAILPFILFICIGLFSGTFLHSQTVGGSTSLSTGWGHSNDNNIWFSSGEAKFKVTADESKTIKAYLEGGVSVVSYPEFTLQDGTTILAGFTPSFNLSKAYIKARLPWFYKQYMRFNSGKQPVSWGYGLYYNAGDLVFGASPDATNSWTTYNTNMTTATDITANAGDLSSLTSSGLSNLRSNTDWMFVAQLPFGYNFFTEFVVLPPINTSNNTKYGRFGTRFVFQPHSKILDAIEVGYLTQGNMKKQATYIGLDGTLWADYTLCSSLVFDNTDNNSTITEKGDGNSDKISLNKDLWNLSFSLFRNFSIRTDVKDHTLGVRIESLYYPIAETLDVFGFISYDITDKTSLGVTYMCNFDCETENINQYTGLSITWTPVKSFDITVQGFTKCDNPNELSAIICSASYMF